MKVAVKVSDLRLSPPRARRREPVRVRARQDFRRHHLPNRSQGALGEASIQLDRTGCRHAGWPYPGSLIHGKAPALKAA